MTDTDSTQRFSNRVDAYMAARPHYPPRIVPYLEREGALYPGARIIDIGAGTGLSSEPFLRAGYEVAGVEPNEAMRAAGLAHLASFPRYRAVNGTADATGLMNESADLWIAGQAFHWFDPAAARLEALRVLRPAGWAALLWNDRDQSSTPFLAGYEDLLCNFGNDYRAIRYKHEDSNSIATFLGGQRPQPHGFPHAHYLAWDSLVALVGSASYMPAPGASAHAEMLAALRQLYDQHAEANGVEMRYVCRVHAAPMTRNA